MIQEIEEVPPEPSPQKNRLLVRRKNQKQTLEKKEKLSFKILFKYFFYSLFLKETDPELRERKLVKFLFIEYAKSYIEKKEKEKKLQEKYKHEKTR